MKIGLVARADNSGLGTVSRELYDNLDIERAVVITNGVYKTFPERFGSALVYPGSLFTDDAVRAFLQGLDCVVTVETPYNWNLYPIARQMGIKTVMLPMYECLPVQHQRPDLYICPSLIDMEAVDGNKVQLPCPVNTDRVWFRKRKKANIFVHNAGHGGLLGRNGTDIFINAIPLVKNPKARFIIRSQTEISLPYNDPRVKVQIANFKEYWDLWDLEGDVFVFPHKFDGLSLPVQEALASGMPLITTEMHPFDKWLPSEFLVPAEKTQEIRISRMITASFVSCETLAARIDAMVGKNIEEQSMLAGAIGEELSWRNWRKMYIAELRKLCEK